MGELADWQCHKIVKAGKILAMGDDDYILIEDVNGAPCKVLPDYKMFARGKPSIGDYFVIYDGGYKSWSPANTFEDGYKKL